MFPITLVLPRRKVQDGVSAGVLAITADGIDISLLVRGARDQDNPYHCYHYYLEVSITVMKNTCLPI